MIIEYVDGDESRIKWSHGGERKFADLDDLIDAYEAEPIKHGYWDSNHCCSNCHNEALSFITQTSEIFDYDWDENLVPTGRFNEVETYFETDYCPHCGAKMDE